MGNNHFSVVIAAILILVTSYAYPQDSNEKIDWDKIEHHLYQELKSTTNKSEAEIHEMMGYALLNSDNQWERAAAHFKKVVKLNPKLYLSWYNLGLIYIDTEEGNNYFKKTIDANPNYPPPYYWLAYTYCRNRKDKEATPIFKKYLEVAQGDTNEASRIEFAQKVLKELISGKEGNNLKSIRAPMPEKLSEKDGNIYVLYDNGNELQITSQGKDFEPKLSPNKEKIIFIRNIKDCPFTSETGFFPSDFDEIWSINLQDGVEHCIVKNNFALISKNNDMSNYLGSFGDLCFSPDGQKIYFLCQNCVVDALLYTANSDGSNIKKIRNAHQLDVIGGTPKDEYYGYLVAGVRNQPPGVVPIKWAVVLMDPEGNEIKEIDDLDKFWKQHQKLD